jgi:hypothetical protein
MSNYFSLRFLKYWHYLQMFQITFVERNEDYILFRDINALYDKSFLRKAVKFDLIFT